MHIGNGKCIKFVLKRFFFNKTQGGWQTSKLW
jgi:hypothetical protein